MGACSGVLCLLFLGLNTLPARAQLRCYSCSFAKPCNPVPTECQDNEACGVSVGTSDKNEVIERKGCLPKAQCPLPGNATYWSRSYTLRHQCCEQDLCNVATATRQPPSLLLASLVFLSVIIFAWGGCLVL